MKTQFILQMEVMYSPGDLFSSLKRRAIKSPKEAIDTAENNRAICFRVIEEETFSMFGRTWHRKEISSQPWSYLCARVHDIETAQKMFSGNDVIQSLVNDPAVEILVEPIRGQFRGIKGEKRLSTPKHEKPFGQDPLR